MRLTIFLLLLFTSFAFAENSNSQNARVNLNVNNVALKNVLDEIEQQTDYLFISNRDVDMEHNVSIKAKSKPVRDVLDKLFENTNLTYAMEGINIILSRKETSSTLSIIQQKRTVTGTILDEKGEPVIGANVIEKGTTNGVVTDVEGNFSLSVSENTTLQISYIGYIEQNITVTGQEKLQISLKEDLLMIDEVIVVGYGTQRKINLTGSVAAVKGDDINKRVVAQTSAALQGMVPGLTITQQSGQPGYDTGGLYIRGIGSINAGTSPLVLVDHVQMNINDIDPNSIESISVLKDAAASSIYGSRAANGVILITTKRAKDNKTHIKYNYNIGMQEATNFPKKVTALEHMEMYDIGLQNVGRDPVFTSDIERYKTNPVDNFSRFETDWADLLLTNNGIMQSHNISVASGSERINVFANAAYLDQNGLTPNTQLRKYNLLLNTDLKIAKGLNLKIDLISNNSNRYEPHTTPPILILHAVGLPAYLPAKFDDGSYGEAWNNFNPIGLAEAGGVNRLTSKTNLLSTSLTYEFLNDFEVSLNYSYKSTNSKRRDMAKQFQVFYPDIVNNDLLEGPFFPSVNSLEDNRSESELHSARFQATYDKTIKNHKLGAIIGLSIEDYDSNYLTGSRQNFLNQDMPYLNMGDASTMTNAGGAGEWSLMSLYARLNYSFKDRYLLELNGRYDGSSRFSKDNRWGVFPSVSAGWRLSEEEFWSSIKPYVTNLKLRGSYGLLGNQELNSNYPTVSAYQTGENYNYFFNNSIVSGYAITDAANSEITWETTKQLNVGADLSFLGNRLYVTYDYYVKNIEDMLQKLPIPLLVGVNAPFINAGSMRNKGWELNIGWRDRVEDFDYSIQFNLSNVKNKVIDLHGEEYINGLRITRENESIDSYYGYISEGLFQTEEEIGRSPTHFATTKPGDIRYRDISGPDGEPDGVIDSFDRAILGNSFPQYEFSLNTEFNWKGFDLSIFLQGVGKKDNYLRGIGAWPFYSVSYQGSAFDFHKDSWSLDNMNAQFPRLTVGIDNNQKHSDFWIRSGAYIRLKNIVFGYTLPSSLTKKIKISQVRLFFSGQNLITFDSFYDGFDPEKDDNTGQFYPIMKTYNFGINISI